MAKEIEKMPFVNQLIEIEQQHVSQFHRENYGIHLYPTIVFAYNNNTMMKKIEGFAPVDEVLNAYKECIRLEKIMRRQG